MQLFISYVLAFGIDVTAVI